MTTQNHGYSTESKRGNGRSEKFPEPRAWALEWDMDESAHFGSGADGSRTVQQKPEEGNAGWDKFPQPRGWSLEWDGPSMPTVQEFDNRHTQSPPVDSCADGT